MNISRAGFLVLIGALAYANAVPAQTTEQVRFPTGADGVTVSGRITGDEYADYRLDAAGGQELYVALTVTETDGHGTVYFNILPPGSTDEAIYNGSMDGDTTTVALTESGAYTVRVYQMGDDEDSGKTSAFAIDLSIR